MALRALRNTYGMESIYGCEVRRFVKAGDIVPPTFVVPDEDVEEVAVSSRIGVSAPRPPQAKVIPEADYGSMTLPQLKEAALSHGIVVTPDAKKADILAALERK